MRKMSLYIGNVELMAVVKGIRNTVVKLNTSGGCTNGGCDDDMKR